MVRRELVRRGVSPSLANLLSGGISQQDREAAESNLGDFIRQAWPVIEPNTEYLHNWHIDAICAHLEAVTAGEITRLVINMPPRYMKSICVSVMWPVWEWLKMPWTRWLFGSYSGDLATKHSVDRRTIIQSPWYQARWSKAYQLTTDQNVKTEYQNTARGVMVATGIHGTAIGKGGNRVVVDDPHDPEGAQSDITRKSTVDAVDQKFSTRLNDKRRDAIIIVMQRLHEEDAAQRALNLGYSHLCLPVTAEHRATISLPSGRVLREREAGELLWPEREGPRELAQAKITLGSYGYSGQYQQQPSPTEGGILKKHWWRYWQFNGQDLPPVRLKLADGSLAEHRAVTLPPVFDSLIQSWDLAFKDTKSSHFVAGQVWGAKLANRFLLDFLLELLSFTGTLKAIRDMRARWPRTDTILVEDKANGPAVISTLQDEIAGIIAVNPEGGKEARANAVSPQIEAGNVFLPHPMIAAWVEPFRESCAKFPTAAHDDDVDAMTQALNRMRDSGEGFVQHNYRQTPGGANVRRREL